MMWHLRLFRRRSNSNNKEENSVKRDLPPIPNEEEDVPHARVHHDEDDTHAHVDHNNNGHNEEDVEEPIMQELIHSMDDTCNTQDDDNDDHRTNAEAVTSMGPVDYTKSVQLAQECGWYWGPISASAAERLLSCESDGSFLVRDSSSDHYLFTLTFKLNHKVKHVRIEHVNGSFTFGKCSSFRGKTIVEFIEGAVAHSRSGRYLFFVRQRPVVGPLRVQLLHPVSRLRHVQSLQHHCRFVILRHVPRDLLHQLPVPKTLQSYLNTPFYFSEAVAILADQARRQAALSNERLLSDSVRNDSNVQNEENSGNGSNNQNESGRNDDSNQESGYHRNGSEETYEANAEA